MSERTRPGSYRYHLMQQTRVLVGGCVSAWVSGKAWESQVLTWSTNIFTCTPSRPDYTGTWLSDRSLQTRLEGRCCRVVGSRRHSEMRPRSMVRKFLWACEKLNHRIIWGEWKYLHGSRDARYRCTDRMTLKALKWKHVLILSTRYGTFNSRYIDGGSRHHDCLRVALLHGELLSD